MGWRWASMGGPPWSRSRGSRPMSFRSGGRRFFAAETGSRGVVEGESEVASWMHWARYMAVVSWSRRVLLGADGEELHHAEDADADDDGGASDASMRVKPRRRAWGDETCTAMWEMSNSGEDEARRLMQVRESPQFSGLTDLQA